MRERVLTRWSAALAVGALGVTGLGVASPALADEADGQPGYSRVALPLATAGTPGADSAAIVQAASGHWNVEASANSVTGVATLTLVNDQGKNEGTPVDLAPLTAITAITSTSADNTRYDAFVTGTDADGDEQLLRVSAANRNTLAGATVTEVLPDEDVRAVRASGSTVYTVTAEGDGFELTARALPDLAPLAAAAAVPTTGDEPLFAFDGTTALYVAGGGELGRLPLDSPSSVTTVALPGEPTALEVDSWSTTAVAVGDAAGTVRTFTTALAPRSTTDVGSSVTELGFARNTTELLATTASDGALHVIGLDDDAAHTTFSVPGARVAAGSLGFDSRTFTTRAVFVDDDGVSHRYGLSLVGPPRITLLSDDLSGKPEDTFAFSYVGWGLSSATFQYSVDGGASWANWWEDSSAAVADGPAPEPRYPSSAAGLPEATIQELPDYTPVGTTHSATAYRTLDATTLRADWRLKTSNDIATVISDTFRISVVEPRAYSITDTVEAGSLTRSQAIDDEAGRLYLPVDRGRDVPGGVTWIDTETGEPADEVIELDTAEPSELAINPDRHELYVSHYRSGALSVIDTVSGELVRTITGGPTYPTALAADRTNGLVYLTGNGVFTIDPEAGTISDEVAITTERYPLIKDVVFDEGNQMLWIAEGRASVITGYSAITGGWVESLSIPVGAFEYDGEALGGRAAALAVDEELGHLYAAVAPTLSDDWTDNRLITIDTATGRHLGSPIELGDTTRELAVNPVTHEIAATNGFSNTLSVVSPNSWSVSDTVDFSAEGVTSGTGAASADVWALSTAASGTRLFVSHPYGTSRVSIVDRVGSVDEVTELTPAPGQDDDTEPEVPENPAWTGPAAPAPSEAPAGAVAASGASLSWSVSDYAEGWMATVFGSVSRDGDKAFSFTDGTGWTDPSTGRTELGWSDGFRLHPYPGLAPDVTLSFGNPTLSIEADGSGELVMDVAWTVSTELVSNGYARVAVATFAPGEVSTADDGTVTFERSPEYEGRSYSTGSLADPRVFPDSFPAEFLDFLAPDVRPWWYASGSGLDATKKPNPVTAVFTPAESGTDEPGTEEPGTEERGTEEPGTDEPGTEEPGTDEPGTEEPGTEEPGTDEPRVTASITLSTEEVAPGGTLTVTADGLSAGSDADVWLHSTPVKVAGLTASADGTAEATVTIPSDTPAGAHRIELRTADAGSAWADLTVTATASADGGTGTDADDSGLLARTGAAPLIGIGAGALALIAGAWIITRARTRSRVDAG
ncbi:hypothetical protein D9V30_09035 [Mycetocola reblochoni]|uniref:Cell surface protein IsdA, transfers heme from hemoglobin to apo-IsdC n=2 Tax=Mycetocola reblochoni TaxID=331618 RepID=A0A1R4KD74_9MICO|nr:HtaA domain-containing protein [Mycetocola reblochoni]RLP69005.1 hypothetical protein D9V30_09035 [Mycetocola reblochoni]SJN42351.1 Cell surface protein IsdA, transfers heme from hemoglobin to apo-IsdC [Mycetocola reblochoni REB411]